jgi:hypothetical protein
VQTLTLESLSEGLRDALRSGDDQQMLAAEQRLGELCKRVRSELDSGQVTSEQFERLRQDFARLTGLVDAAAQFYLGLTSAMKMQLQGYGNTPLADRDQAASRFAVEG